MYNFIAHFLQFDLTFLNIYKCRIVFKRYLNIFDIFSKKFQHKNKSHYESINYFYIMENKIGQQIRERVLASKMGITQFAKAINNERSNVYDIFKRDNIDIKLLKKIGQVLGYDFFQDLLAPETKQSLVLKSNISNKILIEVKLQNEVLSNLNLEEKVIQILKQEKK